MMKMFQLRVHWGLHFVHLLTLIQDVNVGLLVHEEHRAGHLFRDVVAGTG